jgi:Sap, sulfolipid-1-addressing protein
VIVEIFALALASSVRPTSLAAVYALLSHDGRRGLLVSYLVAGLAFTLAFGALILGVTHGIHVGSGTGRTKAIADIAGGIAALAFGVAFATGRIGRGRTDDAPRSPGRMRSALGRRLTTGTAALAGPATHIPGLFYLIALNVIVAHNVEIPEKTIALVTYNAVWFAVPIAALVICIVRPAAARAFVRSIEQWARDHVRGILLGVSFSAGTALVIRGILSL